jgi:hypothetical protein
MQLSQIVLSAIPLFMTTIEQEFKVVKFLWHKNWANGHSNSFYLSSYIYVCRLLPPLPLVLKKTFFCLKLICLGLCLVSLNN